MNELKLTTDDSYNLLLTPRLMWIVKRCSTSVVDPNGSEARIDINSLGFAGTLAVKNEISADYLK